MTTDYNVKEYIKTIQLLNTTVRGPSSCLWLQPLYLYISLDFAYSAQKVVNLVTTDELALLVLATYDSDPSATFVTLSFAHLIWNYRSLGSVSLHFSLQAGHSTLWYTEYLQRSLSGHWSHFLIINALQPPVHCHASVCPILECWFLVRCYVLQCPLMDAVRAQIVGSDRV